MSFVVHSFCFAGSVFFSVFLAFYLGTRDFLLKAFKAKLEGKPLFLVRSPASFVFFLARLLKIPCSGRGFPYFLVKSRIRVDRFFSFCLQEELDEIRIEMGASRSKGAIIVVNVLSQAHEKEEKLSKLFSDDLKTQVQVRALPRVCSEKRSF